MPKKRNALFKTVFSFSQCQQEGEVLFGSAAFLGYSLVNRYFPKKLKYLKLLQLSLLTLEIVNSCACYLLLVDLTLNRESIKDRRRRQFEKHVLPHRHVHAFGVNVKESKASSKLEYLELTYFWTLQPSQGAPEKAATQF